MRTTAFREEAIADHKVGEYKINCKTTEGTPWPLQELKQFMQSLLHLRFHLSVHSVLYISLLQSTFLWILFLV